MPHMRDGLCASGSKRRRRAVVAFVSCLGILGLGSGTIAAGAQAATITLDPPNATNPVGTTHTVTAHVIEASPPGKLVKFTVSGANAGATGTCVPADCRTAADNGVRFTYVGTNAGEDTIEATYVTPEGTTLRATARKLWVARDRKGAFSCRASALRLTGLLEPVVANRPDAPCRDDSATLLRVPLSLGGLSVLATALNARTDQTPDDLSSSAPAVGDQATAHADTATALVSLGISATATAADAKAECTSSGVPTLSSSSKVVGLRVNGQSFDVLTQPVTIPLLLATLRINATINAPGRVTRRAIWLDNLLLPDVIIGEATADYSGNPCDS